MEEVRVLRASEPRRPFVAPCQRGSISLAAPALPFFEVFLVLSRLLCERGKSTSAKRNLPLGVNQTGASVGRWIGRSSVPAPQIEMLA